MRGINAFNEERKFGVLAPFIAVWEVLKEMMDSSDVNKQEEYTAKDYANMFGKQEAGVEEKAKALAQQLDIEKSMLRKAAEQNRVSNVVKKIAEIEQVPHVNNIRVNDTKQESQIGENREER